MKARMRDVSKGTGISVPLLLLGILFTALLSVAVQAQESQCITPTDGMLVDTFVEFCQGTFQLEKGLQMTNTESIIFCSNTKFVPKPGAAESVGIVVNAREAHVKYCSFEGFDIAIKVEDVTQLLLKDNTFLDNRIVLVAPESPEGFNSWNVFARNDQTYSQSAAIPKPTPAPEAETEAATETAPAEGETAPTTEAAPAEEAAPEAPAQPEAISAPETAAPTPSTSWFMQAAKIFVIVLVAIGFLLALRAGIQNFMLERRKKKKKSHHSASKEAEEVGEEESEEETEEEAEEEAEGEAEEEEEKTPSMFDGRAKKTTAKPKSKPAKKEKGKSRGGEEEFSQSVAQLKKMGLLGKKKK